MKKYVLTVALVGIVAMGMMVGCGKGNGYVDLGLSSGTKWKTVNQKGYYTYDDAIEKFGDKLPSKAQWEELERECEFRWVDGKSAKTTGCKVIGPNGNSIFLPAEGGHDCNFTMDKVGTGGCYWSSTPLDSDNSWLLYFSSGGVYMGYCGLRCYGNSIRLVQD